MTSPTRDLDLLDMESFSTLRELSSLTTIQAETGMQEKWTRNSKTSMLNSFLYNSEQPGMLVMDPPFVDFGDLSVGYVYETSFTLKNVGTQGMRYSIKRPDSLFLAVEAPSNYVGLLSMHSFIDISWIDP